MKVQVSLATTGPIALLLEDEPLISMDIEAIFEEEGFNVITVRSCVEANSWLDRRSPDIVIVDIELRDGPCTQVVARLIETNIPFVVHTGAHPSFHTGTPFALGAWVGKPTAPKELIRAATTAIAQNRSTTILAQANDLVCIASTTGDRSPDLVKSRQQRYDHPSVVSHGQVQF